MKILLMFLGVILSFFTLKAQLVVASPTTDAEIQAQTLLMSQLAFQEQIKEYQYYLEYISQFTEIVASIRNTTSAMKDMSKIGRSLKEKSAKEWLKEVESGLSGVFPEYSELKTELSGKAAGLMKGNYSEYISKWDDNTKKYHEQLVNNYENHVMFPELYSASSKSGNEFGKMESAQKIVHKAWMESGLEYEIKDDIIRKNTFKKYYDEYLKQAKSNNNIEALGLANILQAQYLSVETLEHLKKNSDVTAMKEQFEKDAQDSYGKMIMKLLMESGKEDSPTQEKSIFGLEKKGGK